MFNLYINDIPKFLYSFDTHMPKIKHVNILLYADDMVPMSHTQVGMRRLLLRISMYCTLNYLSINKAKTKVVVFWKRRIRYNWTLDRKHTDQVKSYL